ncbi:MAG: alanine--tRNA ligase [Candidatus Babeliales bacterium]
MKSVQIRQKFFDFFIKHEHEKVASSSLIPAQDPTLLFANAGMNQFKDVFLGKEKRSYTRAVSIQKCVRAGGKHNDLENVGFTKRHLTFFEMMGNFSFGDYFKEEAIHFAWNFLTKELNLPVENLHATVYKTDDEAYAIWHKEIGIPANRMHRLGEKENFWQMGDTGPCGPCTEIHIDRGPEFGCKDEKSCGPACDCDRFLEIWNLVFMQFDRQSDGTDKPLKQTGVDTGMGLERLCAVVQDKDSVYQTDLFTPYIAHIEELTGKKYADQDTQMQAAFHVLSDHIRSSTMIIADGGAPSNEGRGYVLRKIIRRAALFAQKLSDKNIFPELSKTVVKELGDIYPELKTNAKTIYKILESEISKFAANLVRGQAMLEKYFVEHASTKKVSGEQAFKLYDTYGFPLELIHVMAQEKGFTVEDDEFNTLMAKQQEQSGKKTTDELNHLLDDSVTTEFTGYTELQTSSTIKNLIFENKVVDGVPANAICWVIAQKSPYFIVGGGQVPDQGSIVVDGRETPLLQVRYINNAIAAQITTPVALKVGDTITSKVDPIWRTNAMKNHTATHLLQAALIELFGKQIKQSGSLVHPDYLRFDFTYHENLSTADLNKVEDLVNQKIMQNIPVNIEYMALPDALKRGALAFFGDKYNPEKVRMVEIPQFSVELCGGTHVKSTGDIGVFKITEISALSAGHRRITAVTGPRALELFQDTFNICKNLSQDFKVQRTHILDAVHKLKEEYKHLQNEYKQLKKQSYQTQLVSWLEQTQIINGVPFLYQELKDASNEELKDLATQLAHKKPGFYFLISLTEGKGTFVAYRASVIKNVDLKKFAEFLKEKHGIRGGGSGTLLQGGAQQFDNTLKEDIQKWLTQNS